MSRDEEFAALAAEYAQADADVITSAVGKLEATNGTD